ncbi:unnamed protein product [Gordionus sp. m RMFG-2023]
MLNNTPYKPRDNSNIQYTNIHQNYEFVPQFKHKNQYTKNHNSGLTNNSYLNGVTNNEKRRHPINFNSFEEKRKKFIKCINESLPLFLAWILLFGTAVAYAYGPGQWLWFSPISSNLHAIYNHKGNNSHIAWLIDLLRPLRLVLYLHSTLFIFLMINFLACIFIDPGIYPRAGQEEELYRNGNSKVIDDFKAPLYERIDIKGVTVQLKWCNTCKFYRPPRCSHCSVCDSCIETFDHHCPWLHNCVGRGNYSLTFLFHHFKTLMTSPGIVTICLCTLAFVLLLPITGLCGFHSLLIIKGRTTNEHVTGKFKSVDNPYNEGWVNNCCRTLASSSSFTRLRCFPNSFYFRAWDRKIYKNYPKKFKKFNDIYNNKQQRSIEKKIRGYMYTPDLVYDKYALSTHKNAKNTVVDIEGVSNEDNNRAVTVSLLPRINNVMNAETTFADDMEVKNIPESSKSSIYHVQQRLPPTKRTELDLDLKYIQV